MTSKSPSVILVNPQMGENIGACARAMLNCGLTDLRLVNPRDGWPNEKASAMASGAFEIIDDPGVFETTQKAIADKHYIYATTARPRDMVIPVMDAHDAARDMTSRLSKGQEIGILFGAERTGLENNDLAMAHCVITIHLNPQFSSLNLAQSVLLVCYELSRLNYPPQASDLPDAANADEFNQLFSRLEEELEKNHFFRNEGQRPSMIRNLRNMLQRSEMTEQEVRTFHGVISALCGKKAPLSDPSGE
jgi:tRNA/rRNA methyltransferase